MKLYNLEIFDKSFNYVGSQQIGEFKAEFDYLSPTNNNINILDETNVNINNIVAIRSLIDEEKYFGIVTDVKIRRNKKQIEFKPLISILDVDVVHGEIITIESWIKDKIEETFVNNADMLQNYQMEVTTNTSTAGSIDSDDYVVNLLETVEYCLKKYAIAVNFDIDFTSQKIKIAIGKVIKPSIVIEADLPNVIEKNISIKSQEFNSLNKITIINISEEGANETITYYRDQSGNITDEPETRIIPVQFKIVTIKAKSEEFEEQALEEATSNLAVEEYNNLIEITLAENDSLFEPWNIDIGQQVIIYSAGKAYNTVFTGYEIQNGKEKLIFGAIRLELTKILKRRLRNERN